MRIRRRLTIEEAILLKLNVKEKQKNKGNPKYGLTQEQLDKLNEFRNKEQINNIIKYSKQPQKLKVESETKPNDYNKPFVLSALDNNGFIMNIDKYSECYNLPRKDITSYKLITHTGTPYYNIVFRENLEISKEINYDFINEIVSKHIKPIKYTPLFQGNGNNFDRLVYCDAHIGMTPNENGYSLYGGKWNKSEIYKRLEEMCLFIKQNSNTNTLVIDDLGDFLDGWDGETTRKGHKLPQNMDNEEMFDVGVYFKVKMIDILINYYDKIIVNNICEDNHAGSFGYVVNSAFKSIVEQKYSNVKVTNHRKFINHYFIGKHCFVISHGKDSKSLKFGFKPQLDPKQAEKIDQYLKQNNIYKDAEFIEFSKGDSHQLLLDYCTSDDFDYCNYHAFSPSSEWVQTNFKKGRSGFVFSNIEYDNNIKNINPYFF